MISSLWHKSIDIRDVPDIFDKFDVSINAMVRVVNEEISMVIGYVTVEDARVMKRQTEWSVVLAVLAAIYLHMTLATGIFGMNIKKIGDPTTAPDKWSVVKAWGVAFGPLLRASWCMRSQDMSCVTGRSAKCC